MYLTRFADIFREQGLAETRSLTTRGYPGLPDDEWALFDSYCTDPACDCQRVMLGVVRRTQMTRGAIASISYGFDRDDELAGPFLDPLNPQCEYAEALLDVVQKLVLSDPAYVARLESHYQQVKRAAANPKDPAYTRIRKHDPEWELHERMARDGAPSVSEAYRLAKSRGDPIAWLSGPGQAKIRSARKPGRKRGRKRR